MKKTIITTAGDFVRAVEVEAIEAFHPTDFDLHIEILAVDELPEILASFEVAAEQFLRLCEMRLEDVAGGDKHRILVLHPVARHLVAASAAADEADADAVVGAEDARRAPGIRCQWRCARGGRGAHRHLQKVTSIDHGSAPRRLFVRQFLDGDHAPAPEGAIHPARRLFVGEVHLDGEHPVGRAAGRVIGRIGEVGDELVVDPHGDVRDVAFDPRTDRVPRLALPCLLPRLVTAAELGDSFCPLLR